MLLGIQPTCEVGKECMELLNTYSGDELQLKLAEAVADKWCDMYKPLEFDRSPPQILQRYRLITNKRERETFNIDNPGWINGEEMTEYGNKKRDTERTNESHRHFLTETLSTLSKAGDTRRATRVKQTLNLYGG